MCPTIPASTDYFLSYELIPLLWSVLATLLLNFTKKLSGIKAYIILFLVQEGLVQALENFKQTDLEWIERLDVTVQTSELLPENPSEETGTLFFQRDYSRSLYAIYYKSWASRANVSDQDDVSFLRVRYWAAKLS